MQVYEQDMKSLLEDRKVGTIKSTLNEIYDLENGKTKTRTKREHSNSIRFNNSNNYLLYHLRDTKTRRNRQVEQDLRV